MERLAPLVLTNAVVAAVLVLAARLASGLTRRQAAVHALCLLALVRLVAPPLLPLPLLPAPVAAAPSAARQVPWSPLRARLLPSRVAAPSAQAVRPAAPLAVPARGVRLDPWTLLVLALAAGSVAILAVTAWRFGRFRRMLAGSTAAPASLEVRVLALSRAIGLRRPPILRLVSARLPPLLWPSLGGAQLVLPRELLGALKDDERDCILAHELAHLRRRDHWVRFVEITATALFWWYPVAWWARAELRRAEERCCDEWVLRLLPRSARAYASGLLKSVTFVAEAPARVPLAASGAGPVRDLEERLKEILMTRPLPQLSTPARIALAAAAAAGLLVFPSRGESLPAASAIVAETPVSAKAPAVAPQQRLHGADLRPTAAAFPAVAARAATTPAPAVAADVAPAALARTPRPEIADGPDEDPALAAERAALDRQRRELHARELELERQSIELETRAERQQLTAEAARLRAEGRADEASRAERRIELGARRLELQQRQLRLELDRNALEDAAEGGSGGTALEAKQQQLEAEMEKVLREMQALDSEQRVQDLRQSGDELKASLAQRAQELRDALPEAGTQKQELEREIEKLESALAALDGGGPMKMRRPSPDAQRRKTLQPQP